MLNNPAYCNNIVKYIALLLFLVVSFAVASPAEASFCRPSHNRTICILSIQRSAKYHWEYRAAVSIDGKERPMEVYNCRDRIKIQPDGTLVSFESHGAGELICSFFKK